MLPFLLHHSCSYGFDEYILFFLVILNFYFIATSFLIYFVIMSIKRKRVVLTFCDKLNILHKMESGESTASIVTEYGIGKSTVSDLKKNSEKIKSIFNKSFCEEVVKKRKTFKNVHDVSLDEAVYRWFIDYRSKSVSVSGCEIKNAAVKLANSLGRNNFVASDGWLWRFLKRHEIYLKKNPLSSEKGKNYSGVYDDEVFKGNKNDNIEKNKCLRLATKIKVEPLPVCEEDNYDSIYESTLETEDPLKVDDHTLISKVNIPIEPLDHFRALRKKNSVLSLFNAQDEGNKKIQKIDDNAALIGSGDGAERTVCYEIADEDKSFFMSLLSTMKELTKSQKNEFKLIVLKELARLAGRNTVSSNPPPTAKSAVFSATCPQTVSLQGVNSGRENLNKPTRFNKIIAEYGVSGRETIQRKLISSNISPTVLTSGTLSGPLVPLTILLTKPLVQPFSSVPQKTNSTSISFIDSCGVRQFPLKVSSFATPVSGHQKDSHDKQVQEKPSKVKHLTSFVCDKQVSNEPTKSVRINPSFLIKSESINIQETTSPSKLLSPDFTSENFILPETVPRYSNCPPQNLVREKESLTLNDSTFDEHIVKETDELVSDITVDEIKLEPVDIEEDPFITIGDDS